MNEYTYELLKTMGPYILATNLLLIAYPIYKMLKKELRCYQTPFLFVFAGITEFMILFGINTFSPNEILYISYPLWVVIFVAPIFSIVIIFGDYEFSIGSKILIFFVFLIIEALFFVASLIITKDGAVCLFYISSTFYSVGPIECLIGCLILKKHSILPILNLFVLLCYNIIGIIINPLLFNYFVFLHFAGCISCFAQIIIYFIFRSGKKNQDTYQTYQTYQTQYLTNQVENIPQEPLYTP